jgi:hypothetical protein
VSQSDASTEDSSDSGATSADAARPPRGGWRAAWPGLALAAIGGLALYADRGVARDYGAHLGPGFIPNVLSAALLVVGLIVAAQDAFRRRNDTAGRVAGAYGPALILVAAAMVFLLSLNLLGVAIAAGLAATIVAGYGLHARPEIFVWSVAASIAVAFLLMSSKLIAKGVELWISWLG